MILNKILISIGCIIIFYFVNSASGEDIEKIPAWAFSPFMSEYAYNKFKEDQNSKGNQGRAYPISRDHSAFFKGANMARYNNNQTQKYMGKVFTIDTRDQKKCYKLRDELWERKSVDQQQLMSMCEEKAGAPYFSVVVFSNAELKEKTPLSVAQKNMIDHTSNLLMASLGFAGILFLLPESVTKWEDKDFGRVFDNYKDHASKKPSRDDDKAWINWLGHPYAGAAYYVLARHEGFSALESFGYSFFVSTFIWEYGVEAFAERPSTQDLWITPVIGSLLGEYFIYLEKRIKQNNGALFGSKRLGMMTLGFMDPASFLSQQINNFTKRKYIKESQFLIKNITQQPTDLDLPKDFLAFELKFKF